MRVTIALLALAATASGAFAQAGSAPVPYGYAPYYEGRSVYGTPIYGGTCQRLCSADTSPCDPPEYKRTDGRCTNPVPGIR